MSDLVHVWFSVQGPSKNVYDAGIDLGQTDEIQVTGSGLMPLASAAERLGWETCGTCNRTPGRVRMVNGKVVSDALGWRLTESTPCPDCVEGAQPPAELVELVATAMAEVWMGPLEPGELDKVYDKEGAEDFRVGARAALLEQARWIGEQ